MRKVIAALALTALLAACDKEAELVFVYEVGGRGETIDVTYQGDDGVVEEEVTVPWTSEEMYTTPSRDLHLEATGSPGDSLVCGLRWRTPMEPYGDNDADSSTQGTNSEPHACELDARAGDGS